MPARESTREILLRDLVNVEGIDYEVLAGRRRLALGHAEGVLRAYREGGARRQHRRADLAHAAAPLRHGRGLVRARRQRRGARPDGGRVRDGDGGRRVRLLDRHARQSPRLRRPAARLSQRQPATSSRALCNVLRDQARGVVTIALDSLRQGVQYISEEDVAMLRFLVEESARPVSFLPMVAMTGDLDFGAKQLARLGDLADKVVPQVSPMPIVFMHTMRKPFKFSEFAVWRPALNGTYEEQRRLYGDAEFRRAAKAEQQGHIRKIPWERVRVAGARAARPRGTLHGRTIGRHRSGRGQGAARRLPRPDARGRSAHPVPVREREPRSRRRPLAAAGAALHARHLGRRRPRRSGLRPALSDGPARRLGARAAGALARAGNLEADRPPGPGVRPAPPRPPPARLSRRRHPVRSRRRSAPTRRCSSTTCPRAVAG